MQRVPPVDGEFDDRHIDEADERHDARDAPPRGADRSIACQTAMIAEIEQEQHEHRGEPRIPHPPGAPHRLAPQRAGGERQESEARADRRRGLRRDIGERMAEDDGRAAAPAP